MIGNVPHPLGEGRVGVQDGGQGYYDYPVVRRPVWTWEIPTYFWLGGLAGGAYLTASLAQRFGSDDDRRIAADGYYLVGGVGHHEDIWRMASVRGPEGFIVNLAQRIN